MSPVGLSKVTAVSVKCLVSTAGPTMPERKTETALLRMPQKASQTEPLVVETVGHIYKQTNEFTYPGGVVKCRPQARDRKKDQAHPDVLTSVRPGALQPTERAINLGSSDVEGRCSGDSCLKMRDMDTRSRALRKAANATSHLE